MSADVSAYAFLLTGQYPPFWGDGERVQSYPVQLSLAYPEHSSRLLIFFRWLPRPSASLDLRGDSANPDH